MDYKKLMESLSKDTLKMVIEDLLEQALCHHPTLAPPPLPLHVVRHWEVVKAALRCMTTQELTEYAKQFRLLLDRVEG